MWKWKVFLKENHIEKFQEGIILDDGYQTLPAKLEIIEGDFLSKSKLTITEGGNFIRLRGCLRL